MKKIIITFLLAFNIVIFQSDLNAQTTDCSMFCAAAISPDSTSDSSIFVSISFYAYFGAFINYPYITAITDNNGDTLGTGYMFFFGQMNETTVDYPVDINMSEFPPNFQGTIHLTYDSGEMCELPFPCLTNSIESIESTASLNVNAYPNPFNEFTTISFGKKIENANIELLNLQGQIVKVIQRFSGENLMFMRNELPAATYILRITQDDQVVHCGRLIVMD